MALEALPADPAVWITVEAMSDLIHGLRRQSRFFKVRDYQKRREKWSAGYAAYHLQVVNACCRLLGENHRPYFDQECDFLEEYVTGTAPEDVAQEQRDSIQGDY